MEEGIYKYLSDMFIRVMERIGFLNLDGVELLFIFLWRKVNQDIMVIQYSL